jgi:hypothetical protein
VRSILAVLAATLTVAAGTGCGDDDDGGAAGTAGTAAAATEQPPGTTAEEPVETEPADAPETRPEPAPTQSRWAEQVDAACKPWQERIDAVPPPADAASLEDFLALVVPLAGKQAAAVAAVKPPADDDEAETAQLFVAALGELERSLTGYLAAIRRNDAAAIQEALLAANAAGASARGYAVALGITECGGYSSG